MRTICASVVSRPTRVARNRKVPVRFIVAPTTSEPGSFSTGIDSPVSIDSSTAERPSRITPSVGMRSPGRTTQTSSARSSAAGISTSRPSRTTRAVGGARSSSRRTASDVRRRARASSVRPSRISVTIMHAVSK
jgi:hypothetical protein